MEGPSLFEEEPHGSQEREPAQSDGSAKHDKIPSTDDQARG
jgi:hypothetical protein